MVSYACVSVVFVSFYMMYVGIALMPLGRALQKHMVFQSLVTSLWRMTYWRGCPSAPTLTCTGMCRKVASYSWNWHQSGCGWMEGKAASQSSFLMYVTVFLHLLFCLMVLPLSESHTFNKLESIATSPRPTTPVLGCHIVKALELEHVGNKVHMYWVWHNMACTDILL